MTILKTEQNVKQLREDLHVRVASVTFTKQDGTERKMLCTLKPDMLPKVELNESKKERKVNAPLLVVAYDLEKQAWRSFNYDTVTNVEFVG